MIALSDTRNVVIVFCGLFVQVQVHMWYKLNLTREDHLRNGTAYVLAVECCVYIFNSVEPLPVYEDCSLVPGCCSCA